ncbi:unnamed protein product [Ambrosiozyma monospora]|uniref:Unnamed protein product n=1 Tax=Ambrosiozyma monospora TaxID=43982 RepID=A0ACB5T842_AMBMO|nr:unnamed protein product [Ambrosiozyma monospora]
MDLKGPVSLPDGEITPNTDATNKIVKFDVPEAKTPPDKNTKILPMIITLLFPILLEFQVRKYDSTESPIIVSDMKRPMLGSEMCSSLR